MRKNVAETGEEERMLIFRLQDKDLGLNISCVREVLNLQKIQPLPRAPHFIEGVINLRKYIIVVIDLRKKFNITPSENKADQRIIICKIKTFIVGIIVDSVSKISSFSKHDIQSTPEILSLQMPHACFSGIIRAGERVIAILDLEKVLTQEEMTNLSEIRK
jgi:purine-binding chemotaxis protein CheW